MSVAIAVPVRTAYIRGRRSQIRPTRHAPQTPGRARSRTLARRHCKPREVLRALSTGQRQGYGPLTPLSLLFPVPI